MGNLTDFFNETIPKPRYQFGDRVEGTYQGVPFVGTVGADNIRNLSEGPKVTVSLDLPFKLDDVVYNVVCVAYSDITGLRKCT